jgi:major membrane immunogen (membrane-anchored lipoprotein)
MRRLLAVLIASAMMAILLTGCGQKEKAVEDHSGHTSPAATHSATYKDGTYTAQSTPDERGAVGELTMTIQQGKITQADYKGIQKDGKIKDADYGKTNGKIENQEFYNKAQHALKAAGTYAPKLLETQNVDKIDSISGATVSYKQFSEATKKALAQAQ